MPKRKAYQGSRGLTDKMGFALHRMALALWGDFAD